MKYVTVEIFNGYVKWVWGVGIAQAVFDVLFCVFMVFIHVEIPSIGCFNVNALKLLRFHLRFILFCLVNSLVEY